MPSSDPTNPVPISSPTPGAYQYLCDPPQTPPVVTPGESSKVLISTVTFNCDLTSVLFGDVRLPISSVEYSNRGCYVTTPNTLSIKVPASADLTTILDNRLDDGVIVVNRNTTNVEGEVVSEEMVSANFDSWVMMKDLEGWYFELSGTKVITYSSNMHRTIYSAKSREGDFTDYAKDKTIQLNGWDAAFINPGDYIAYGSIGLYIDKLVGKIWKGGYGVSATQFGRFL